MYRVDDCVSPMDSPAKPGRFRLRIMVYAPSDSQDLTAMPLHRFLLVKTPEVDLANCSLRQMRDMIIERYRRMYPNES